MRPVLQVPGRQVRAKDKVSESSTLTLLERTSSIYFSNGTAIDIAKVEGGGRYKHIMRHIQAPHVPAFSPETPGLRYPGEEIAQSSQLLRMQRTLPLPSFLHKAFDRWLVRQKEGGRVSVSPGSQLPIRPGQIAYLVGRVAFEASFL